MIKSMQVDFTSLNLWRTCPQKFAYRTMHSLVSPFDSPALEFGKLIHYGIEWVNKLNAQPDLKAYEELEYLASKEMPTPEMAGIKPSPLIEALNRTSWEASKSAIFNVQPDERRSLKHLLLLLIKYVERWNPDVLRTSQCEVKHQSYLGDTASGIKIYYKGTLDGFKDGKVIERKTTSYLNTGFINRINPNAQACGYIFLARDLFGDPAINTVIFDAISTGGYGKSEGAVTSNPGRWKIHTDPTSLFLRAETYRSEEQLAEWRSQVLYDCERIAQDIIRGKYSANQPDACTAFNSTCPYIDVCRASSNQRPNLIDNTFKQELWDGFKLNLEGV